MSLSHHRNHAKVPDLRNWSIIEARKNVFFFPMKKYLHFPSRNKAE